MTIILCRLDTDLTYYIVGFQPNATKATAHHMLVYGCEEPGAVHSTNQLAAKTKVRGTQLNKGTFHRNIISQLLHNLLVSLKGSETL